MENLIAVLSDIFSLQYLTIKQWELAAEIRKKRPKKARLANRSAVESETFIDQFVFFSFLLLAGGAK